MDNTPEIYDGVAEVARLGVSTEAMISKTVGAQPHPPSAKTAAVARDAAINAVTVTVEELPSSPELVLPHGGTSDKPAATGPDETKIGSFTCFARLPAELRLKILLLSSLQGRTIELHTRRTHYADRAYAPSYWPGSGTASSFPQWLSDSKNPPALSVNSEARVAALEFYTVRLPLAYSPAQRGVSPAGGGDEGREQGRRHGNTGTASDSDASLYRTQNVARERPGDLFRHTHRCLYINLEVDTVLLLGDLHYERLTQLLSWFRGCNDGGRGSKAASRKSHGGGKGLKRLAMSVGPWSHQVGAATLKAFARTVFADVEEFALFAYPDRAPPENWDGSQIVQEECVQDDSYRRFVMGRGKQFRDGDGWMAVGKRSLKIVDIRFDSNTQLGPK